MKPKHVGDLAIDEAFSYQRKAWVVQRIAWCGFVLLLLAALLGLFGRGGFSQKRKATPDGALVLEY